MVLVDIKTWILLLVAVQWVRASRLCHRLNGKIVKVAFKDSLTNEVGLRLKSCQITDVITIDGVKSSRTVLLDPRMLKSRTIAGSIIAHGPMDPLVYSFPPPFIGSIKACAALGGRSAGVLDSNFIYQAPGIEEGICVFADSSFVDFWTMGALSRSILANSRDATFRRVLQVVSPLVFKNLKPKTTFNNYSIFFDQANLAPCGSDNDCKSRTACDNQTTPICRKGRCVSDASDTKCKSYSDCTRKTYLEMDYGGRRGYCLKNRGEGEVNCVQGQCLPALVDLKEA
mmetsp:Transcript_14646/g.23843  ORF Transcript_14646/g.23843 Transcript_14646/m.23843 type:complete len:285 (+) Transcript_14646:206-1060(+)|eukprot:CAMPEP_0203787534 /NCGR_PEP_ID=MMETSP0100_2-20121128/2296_1 /ASSEMBLY_ACC=CAM_ASM_000210 /TAXON_ID=96639 /ORGANISM=" , Strain NY0313808BC1" /LENGTH=284 /DNA_ID=CAMNT_0050690079 /DNA_START=194 /DNA_END=1048 /DNA_ORIENTATION=+